MVAVAIAVPVGDVIASALVDVARAVANPAGVECPDATVDVVADAVAVHICRASPAAHTEGVKLVPVAIAKTWNQVLAPALQDRTRSIADAACVQGTHAVVHVVTNAIPVHIC